MRWIVWASALSILILVQAANVEAAGCSTCNGNDGGSYRAYRGPACYSPNGYNLTPGCCICPPSACDNAWDGYCQEKAKWQAYFTQVGTPRTHCHGCPTMVPAETCFGSPTFQPVAEPQPKPAVKSPLPPAPVPAAMLPSKDTRKTTNQWFRL